jgi:hypothetical protein
VARFKDDRHDSNPGYFVAAKAYGGRGANRCALIAHPFQKFIKYF